MPVDEQVLAAKYDLHKLTIHQSTHISSRVQSAIAVLHTQPREDGKPVIAVLVAKGRAINKLVSITEIAKRDLATKGIKALQYTGLGSVKLKLPRMPAKPLTPSGDVDSQPGGNGNSDDEDQDEVEDAFQIMGKTMDEGTKDRQVPVITIYLATTAIKELHDAFG